MSLANGILFCTKVLAWWMSVTDRWTDRQTDRPDHSNMCRNN